MIESGLEKIKRILKKPKGINSVNLYFFLKSSKVLKRIDLIDNSLQSLAHNVCEDSLKIFKDSQNIVNISSFENTKNAIFKYDLDYTDKLASFLDLIRNISLYEEDFFDIKDDDFKDVGFYIFKFGSEKENFYSVRKSYAINVYGNDKRFIIFPDSNRFRKIDKNLFNVDTKVDFFMVDDELYFINLKILESYFGFDAIIKENAKKSMDKIKKLDILVEDAPLRKRIEEGDLTFSRKLSKINVDSPVFEVKKREIIKFSKNNDFLKGEFDYDEEDKILLSTKKSQDLFVKLLNDNFVKSELTKVNYDAEGKEIKRDDK
ncbi:anti-phage protein KwaB [Oceanotoga teriensis]|uniref:Uncharacterized protein DUF4868 n=1 Tax=Oceanotoga teriensis TaxID=515440 RepID=A0AA45HHQ0_9BACT|nr:anti-phage protein KwaB [Oceanotoga teriensis]MDO7975797.1 DUF4868 domain-containing protein [Oceanotoga teriensis]PWJ88079.1 uncharacterized protein DUF4868 [Oceanotoga teriensis]